MSKAPRWDEGVLQRLGLGLREAAHGDFLIAWALAAACWRLFKTCWHLGAKAGNAIADKLEKPRKRVHNTSYQNETRGKK